MTTIKKQKTILDFFKKTKVVDLVEKELIVEKDNFQRKIKILNEKTNQNKSIENENEIESGFSTNKDSLIDINYVDESLLNISIEEINESNGDSFEDIEKKIMYSSNYVTFRSIIKTTISDPHYEHLFDENDWNQIEDFTSLNGPVQLLYIKLYMRKHDWIKTTNIKYPDIDLQSNHQKELKTLLQHDFLIDSSHFGSVEEGLSMMSLQEIKTFLKNYNGFKLINTNKQKLIPSFIDYIKITRSVKTNSPIENEVLNRLKSTYLNKCVKINEEKSKLFDRIFILFHCPNSLIEKIKDQNENQWYRGILGDYSISNENYPLLMTNKISAIYICREELIEFSKAFTILCEILVLIKKRQYTKIVENFLPEALKNFSKCFNEWSEKDHKLEIFLRQFTATGMYLRVIHQCLTALEKIQMYIDYIKIVEELLSQSIYGLRYRSHWYQRASLISHCYLKNLELTEKFCLYGLNDDSLKFDHRLDLYARLSKLKTISINILDLCPEFHKMEYNKKTIYADYRRLDHKCNVNYMKNFFFHTHENGDEEVITVEEVVIRHYKNLDYPNGIHCESLIYHMIFGLLFWDIIYSLDFPDCFYYHKQIIPLDLCFDSFYEKRKNLIDKRILQIENFTDHELESELTNMWTKYENKASLLVNWNLITLDKLIEIALCLSGKKLAKILYLLAKNFRHLKKGFPDLIVWNAEKKKIKIIEVKGPLDRISHIQSIWLSHFYNMQLDAELCYVKPKMKQN